MDKPKKIIGLGVLRGFIFHFRDLSGSWGRPGGGFGRLGESWRRLGGVLEAFWSVWGASWGVLRRLGASWARFEGQQAPKRVSAVAVTHLCLAPGNPLISKKKRNSTAGKPSELSTEPLPEPRHAAGPLQGPVRIYIQSAAELRTRHRAWWLVISTPKSITN